MKTHNQINTIKDFAKWVKDYNTTIETIYYESYIKGVHYNIVKRKRHLKQTVEKFVIKYSNENKVSKTSVYIEIFRINAGI
jgi:hypothetical protein